jgi:hypothetical protein
VPAFDRVLDLVLTDDVEALWEVNIELIRRFQSIDELSYVLRTRRYEGSGEPKTSAG